MAKSHEHVGAIPKEIAHDDYAILEVGAGRNDEFEDWTPIIERRRLFSSQQYIGLDIGTQADPQYEYGLIDDNVRAKLDKGMRLDWNTIKKERPAERISFMQGDGLALPFRPNTVNEVILSNMFSTETPPEVMRQLFSEAYRVAKPVGNIVIHNDRQTRFMVEGSLVNWIIRNHLPLPRGVKYYNESMHSVQYTRMAKGYGLPYGKYRYDIYNNQHRAFYEPFIRQHTIWVMGKTATV